MKKSKRKTNSAPMRAMAEIVSDTEHLSVEKIQAVLSEKAAKGIILQYVYCLHDKDQYTEDTDLHKAGDFKKPHFHVFIRLNQSRSFEDIAAWFGLDAQFVNAIKARTFDAGCLYATHTNAPDKYQYPVSHAVADFNYAGLVEAYKEKSKKQAGKEKLYARKMQIVRLIDNGTIRPFNLSQFVTAEEEVLFSSAIKIAQDRVVRDLGNQTSRNMRCIYISGDAGAGKTTFAKMLCEKEGLSYAVAGSERDPFQSYGGQDALIFDDISFSVFDWKELLKISDNHTASLVGSRYRDKALQCKLIIITTTQEPRELAKNMAGADGEDRKQLYRRYSTYYKMNRETVMLYKYNEVEGKYEYQDTYTNMVRPYIDRMKNSQEDLQIEEDPMKIFNAYFAKNNCALLDLRKRDPKKDEVVAGFEMVDLPTYSELLAIPQEPHPLLEALAQ